MQEQGVTALQAYQQNENTQLQSSLSNEYDTDFAQAATNFSSQEIAYQASLQTMATLMKMTLLNYL